ncbi:MAG: TPM domain-containing protein [Cytophagales bacterium]
MMAEYFFSVTDKENIIKAIRNAETKCSGEIRVHVDEDCEIDPLDRAVEVFRLLGMEKTKLRNGVLFYVSVEDHKFAVIGDVGINMKVGNDFWHEIRDIVLEEFKRNDYCGGLVKGIEKVGFALSSHFPYDSKNDANELTDEISFKNKK